MEEIKVWVRNSNAEQKTFFNVILRFFDILSSREISKEKKNMQIIIWLIMGVISHYWIIRFNLKHE